MEETWRLSSVKDVPCRKERAWGRGHERTNGCVRFEHRTEVEAKMNLKEIFVHAKSEI
jgi:hypothetical protein